MKTSAAFSAAIVLLLHSSDGFAPTPRLQTGSSPIVGVKRMKLNSNSNSRLDPFLWLNVPNNLDENLISKDRQSPGIVKRVSTDPKPFFVELLETTMGDTNSKQNMRFLATALAMALVFLPLSSEAAMSGGRMGGSYSRPSQSRSMPSRSSSGGGYNRGYSQGYSTGYYSRPSVVVTPGIGFGYSPFVSPFSPFGGGYYGGGVGGGVVSYARGPSLFDIMFFGGLVLAVTSFVRSATTSETMSSSPFGQFGSSVSSALGSGTSVVQLSVAMDVPNRDDPNSILSVLDRLSRTANTDNRVGIQNLTSQVALELLRRRSSIVSASSSYQHYADSTKAGRDYEAKAIKERSKFEKETVSKYGGVDYSSSRSPVPVPVPSSSSLVDGKATMAVVTLVLAIDGDSTKIPTNINSLADVEEALRKIASDSKVDDCLQSVEILWTPEDRSETLSRREVLADYPELRSV